MKCQNCGHDKRAHIYEEGACRPGFVCEKACDKFVVPQAVAEKKFPPKLYLRRVDVEDVASFDGGEGDVHAIYSPRSVLITHADLYLSLSESEAITSKAVARTWEEASKHCVCSRNTKGFDYGETHEKLGKPRIGSRWQTVSDIASDRAKGGRDNG